MDQAKSRHQSEWRAVLGPTVHKQIPTNPNDLKQRCKIEPTKILLKKML